MTTHERSSVDPGSEGSFTLSTGQTVDLPLSTEATMLGAVFSASRKAVDDLLPRELQPVRATPTGKAAVTFLSVEYRHIGVDGIDSYDEFGVVFPAVRRSTPTVPYLSALYRSMRGYVWSLPVTTEPAKALGVDIWGYPKFVADTTHKEDDSRRRTTVSVDDDRLVTLQVDRSPSVQVRDEGYNYTVSDDELLRIPVDVDAELGGWPLGGGVSLSLGSHPRVEPLKNLDISERALGRLSLDGEVRFHTGEPIR